MPDIPDPPASAHTLPSAAGEDDETAIRLLLDALVRRLRQQPLQLAERVAGCGPGSRPPGSTPSPGVG